MNFISLFSGIGGFDLGFERAGMECVAQVENNAQAASVLVRHFPTVQRFGDVCHVGRHNLPAADLVCGGFPCQDVSVAGNRAGLAGERSGLWFEFLRILTELTPRWCVIENVPGLLSSNGGRDFAVILRGLVECGYGVAWRVLDAQHFGVAQRRRRVFIVGHLGDGRAAEILFERAGGAGNIEPGGAAGERLAATVSASAPSRRNGGSDPAAGHFIYNEQRIDQYADASVASTRASRDGKGVRTMVVNGNSTPEVSDDLAFPLRANDGSGNRQVIAEAIDVRNSRFNGDISGTLQSKANGGYSLNYQNPIAFMAGQGAKAGSIAASETLSPTLKGAGSGTNQVPSVAFDWMAGGGSERVRTVRAGDYTGSLQTSKRDAVAGSFGVRRLTPTECERLQGFPRDWTAGQSDSARYRQLGNAVAVPVITWLGERIIAVSS